MNIIEVEDKLKSIPDDNLSGEMTNPSGMFPQYLVMSEITRRKEMRDDYEGRMAANAKTPPRPSMREEMAMQVAQAQPQPNPMQQQGIGSLLQPQAVAQQPQPMMSNQPVMMQVGTQVPNLLEGLDPKTQSYFDYMNYGTAKDREESESEKLIREYYESMNKLMPKKLEEEKKFLGGLNLLKAGLAVGTSATPQDLNKNLSSTIDSIAKTNQQIDKKEGNFQKLQLEQATLKASQEGKERAQRTSDVGVLQKGDYNRIQENYYTNLIKNAKDKNLFDQMSKTEQEIVGILNLKDKDVAKTLPIYFTEEEAMADPSGNTKAGAIDYNRLNDMASQRVAASSIYTGKSNIQRDIVGTVTEADPFGTMILKKQFDNKYPDGLNPDGQTFDEYLNTMKLAQIKELVQIARQAENSK
tara:strand:+ start:153 stop:1388 length:1236 start_codon:yes stop_codon:yes gene_type:complete